MAAQRETHRFGQMIAALFAVSLFIAPALSDANEQCVTTIFLVRHAEKMSETDRDPELSAMGQSRAVALAKMLTHEQVSAIYCTPFKRTRGTAQPLADEKKIVIADYRSEKDLAEQILEKHRGQRLLVVGHSNTVPNFLRLFGSDLKDAVIDEYDNLFVISIIESADRSTSTYAILRLRFPSEWD